MDTTIRAIRRVVYVLLVLVGIEVYRFIILFAWLADMPVIKQVIVLRGGAVNLVALIITFVIVFLVNMWITTWLVKPLPREVKSKD